ncbi:flagellar basal body rod protein FlgC [Rhodosalinus sediminis]|uniref:Flagellar basal-body rod protein FlgC n=1 Tax=Rhodosalinus sediminis TaxID=1940533 RepID=A0A3D9BXU2_9RHOB|nr:flagellar basal body rod protein FlgC [Rhodosalinus sediminis]REC58380.1 flagellar basal body rod protein FlgC [Rhodosalinus sediminis]
MSDVSNLFDLSKRAMSAQMVRLNTVASNIANADSVASSPEGAFRPLRPVFATELADQARAPGVAAANVERIVALDREPAKHYRPDHPLADDEGFVYQAAVNRDEEMVEMLEASRQYQNSLQVVDTVRSLVARTVTMGR